MTDNLSDYQKEIKKLLHTDWLIVPKFELIEKKEESPKKKETWSIEMDSLIHWFLSADLLPKEQFQLTQGIVVSDPQKFYSSLHEDISCGPQGIRARFGGLRNDLLFLKKIKEEKANGNSIT